MWECLYDRGCVPSCSGTGMSSRERKMWLVPREVRRLLEIPVWVCDMDDERGVVKDNRFTSLAVGAEIMGLVKVAWWQHVSWRDLNGGSAGWCVCTFLMNAAMSFSMLYFSRAWVAHSTASCCMSSDMSAFLITAFLSDMVALGNQNTVEDSSSSSQAQFFSLSLSLSHTHTHTDRLCPPPPPQRPCGCHHRWIQMIV